MRCTVVTVGSEHCKDNQTAAIIVKTAKLQWCLLFVSSEMIMMMLMMVPWAARGSRLRIRTGELFCCATVTSHMAYLLLPGREVEFRATSNGRKLHLAGGTTGEGVPQGLVPASCLLLPVISSNCDSLMLVFPV